MSVFNDVKAFFTNPGNSHLRKTANKRYESLSNLSITLCAIDALYLANLVGTAISSPVTSPLLLLNIAFSSATTLGFWDVSKIASNAYKASSGKNTQVLKNIKAASKTEELCDVLYEGTTIVSLAHRILRVKPETRARPLGLLPLFADIQTEKV